MGLDKNLSLLTIGLASEAALQGCDPKIRLCKAYGATGSV
jgi:hypothetical protein